MNESVLSSIIFAAQFSVATIIASVGVLILAVTAIALNRLFHTFWIPTNFFQWVSNFLNDKNATQKRLDPILPGGGPGEKFDPSKHTTYTVTAGKDGIAKGTTYTVTAGKDGIAKGPVMTGVGGGGITKDKK